MCDLAADDLFESVTADGSSDETTTCRHLVAGLHTGFHRVLYVSMTTGNVMGRLSEDPP